MVQPEEIDGVGRETLLLGGGERGMMWITECGHREATYPGHLCNPWGCNRVGHISATKQQRQRTYGTHNLNCKAVLLLFVLSKQKPPHQLERRGVLFFLNSTLIYKWDVWLHPGLTCLKIPPMTFQSSGITSNALGVSLGILTAFFISKVTY